MKARFDLPDISFVDVDPEGLENLAVKKFEALQGVSLDEADPRRKFIQSNIFVATLLANGIDYTGKQNLLAYALDNNLDHLGVKRNVPRLKPMAAETVIRFEVNNPVPFTISKETYLSINGINFYLKEDTPVEVGTTFVDIEAICEIAGTAGNGFLPEQIVNIVNAPPWVSAAYNITKSEGGSDWEEDDPYAERIRQSNAQYSTAGPDDAYKYHAKSANARIVDVSVSSPSPGKVLIIPLLKDGETPDDTILEQIYDKVRAKTVRPITDHVTVSRATEIPYEIDVTYSISSEKAKFLSTIQGSINDAINQYQKAQKSKLGKDIDPSELNSLIKEAGGVRITVNKPAAYVVLDRTQIGNAVSVTSTYGGVIDD